MRKAEKYKMIRQGTHDEFETLDSFGQTTTEQLKQADVVLCHSRNTITHYSKEYEVVYIMPMKGYKPLKELGRPTIDELDEVVQEFIQERINDKATVKANREKSKAYDKKLKEKYENINFEEIHDWALRVSKKAVQQAHYKYGEPDLACGFAWVNVYGVRQNSKLGKRLEKLGYSWSHYEKSYSIWKPADYNGQCIMIHEAGANAYAKVLSEAGVRAFAGSRLD